MIEINSLFDISIIIAIFAASMLYFGKLICDIDVEFHEKLDYSMHGLIFILVWVVLPFSAAYVIYNNSSSTLKTLNVGNLINFVLLVILLLLVICGKKHSDLSKKAISPKGSKDIFIKYIGNEYCLMFYSFIAFLIILYNYLFIETDLLNFVYSILTTFLLLTVCAIITAYNRIKEYPKVRIYFQNGTIVDGTILKYEDFIRILVNGNKVRINKDAIIRIEEL
jgi:hypothetical protein